MSLEDYNKKYKSDDFSKGPNVYHIEKAYFLPQKIQHKGNVMKLYENADKFGNENINFIKKIVKDDNFI